MHGIIENLSKIVVSMKSEMDNPLSSWMILGNKHLGSMRKIDGRIFKLCSTTINKCILANIGTKTTWTLDGGN
jgi:hypothetical protein